MTDSDYSKLLQYWTIDFAASESNREIQGSPERTSERVVVRDTTGKRWILEKIDSENLVRKKQIAFQLEALNSSGLIQVDPYRKNQKQGYFSSHQGQSWMIRPFIEGIPLDRNSYLTELWRAEAMAGFLIEMHPLARAIVPSSMSAFSMPLYAEGRMEVWENRYPELVKKLMPSFQTLEKRFFGVHDSLPTAFCHGDYHPLNMIWGEGRIESVIDWEFCGVKPEMYDVALLLGCLGFDDPDALIGPLVIQLVQQLRAANLFSQQSWVTLLDLMATIRTGWMSEWIRRSDEDAIKMEVLYIDILVDQKGYIEQHWA